GRPVDYAQTNRLGIYRLRAPTRDTAAGYVVSVEHDGIGYFSQPLSARGHVSDSAATIVVFDTSYTRPEIVVAERHVIIWSVGENGMRRVVELLVLGNHGGLTRVTDDETQPVWQGAIPSEAVQFEVGQSDVSPETVFRVGDSVAVLAPLPPGDKQILLAYFVPGTLKRLTVPVDHPVTNMNLMLEDPSATVEADGFVPAGLEQLDEVSFLRFGATAVPAGSEVVVQFASPPFALVELWWIVVPFTAAALAGTLFWWLRRRPAPVTSDGADALAGRIAQLDREFESAASPSQAEQDAYRRRRAELKAQLSERLASHRRPD
ncbi:MAG: hypothetical protein JSW71_08595, partial [Gemmatimonadota bacterium]